MTSFHPLSIGGQVLNVIVTAAILVQLVHSCIALRNHVRSPKVAAQPSLLRQMHLPLSTCIRITVVCGSVSGVGGAVAAAASSFLQLPVSDDGLRFV